MKKSKIAKLLGNIAFFIILIILTCYILFKDQSITAFLTILKEIKVQYLCIGLLCMVLYLVCESINLGRTLKALNEKSNFIKNFKYVLIGFFFSSITPAASGGQPMQIYYMYKDNISVPNSTLALLINLTSMQIITISFAFISLIFNYQYLNKLLIICFVIGVTLNLSALVLLLIGIFSKRMSNALINIAIKIIKFFRVKNIEEKKEKLENALSKYQQSAIYIKSHKVIILKIVALTAVQFLLFYSISYWTYRALGLNINNVLEITTMQAVLYATVSGIPSPGAVGVSEGAFTEIFRNVYPENIMASSVFLNRFINFYLFVIISLIVVAINHVKSKREDIHSSQK